MKIKEARRLLESYIGSIPDVLYQRARHLFESEIEERIKLRSRGKPPSRGVIESVLSEMREWFLKVAAGLPWSEPSLPEKIIEWETGAVWVRHKQLDPRVEGYRKRARFEMLSRTPFPLAAALTGESLDAVTSMMMAQLREDAIAASETWKKAEALAKEKGLKVCPWRVEARACGHSKSYSTSAEVFPASTSDIAFLCNLKEGEKCPKHKEKEATI